MADNSSKFKVKSIQFKTSDGTILRKDVPSELNQELVPLIKLPEYIIRVVKVGRPVPEKEFIELRTATNAYAGFLIPSAAILSESNPNNDNPNFGAYSLIVAVQLAVQSFSGLYDLVEGKIGSHSKIEDIFVKDCFYAIIWKKNFKDSLVNFEQRYFASFYKNGLVFVADHRQPTYSIEQGPITTLISLKENDQLPPHIYKLMVEYLPFAENGFLKFFYVYQIIEFLMFSKFKDMYDEVKAGLDAVQSITVTALRDFLKKFGDAAKEDTRINALLSAKSSETELMAHEILDKLAIDRSKFCFADSIYKVRNLVFHDFPSVQEFESEINELSNSLLRYLMEHYIK